MRRLDFLMTQARRESENDGDVTSSAGISDEELVQFANDAQDHLVSRIEKIVPDAFTEEYITNIVANQESYAFPEESLLKKNLDTVEYSYTGNLQDYVTLRKGTIQERDTSSVALNPYIYIVRGNSILINPIPSSSITNGLRINYSERPPRVDKRRGIVDSVTLNSVSRTITALSVDETETNPQFDTGNFLVDDYICIVNRDGIQQMKKIPIDGINSSGDITIAAGFVYESGETISVGDYVASGKFATTHSELPDLLERYLLRAMTWKLLHRDSSADQAFSKQELDEMEIDILEAYAALSNDIDYITILDDTFLVL